MATSIEKASKPKSRKLIIVIAALVILGLAGSAAAYFLTMNHKGPEAAALPADPIFIALEPFTVNLQPNSPSKFLHTGMTLKVADIKSQAQVTQYLPEVRSRVLNVLSNRSSDTLITPDAKARLGGEIMAALNQPFAPNLPPPKMSSVMFTTFMLQ